MNMHDRLSRYHLTKDEREHLKVLATQMAVAENAQADELIEKCHNKYQYAKTYSVYVKDWENTHNSLEAQLHNGELPHGVSTTMHKTVIEIGEQIMEDKLDKLRREFHLKFHESIYNYLGTDGKTKGIFSGLFG